MYVAPDFTQKAQQQNKLSKPNAYDGQGDAFRSVLNASLQQKAVESTQESSQSSVRKKKKDTKEIFDELKEGREDLYDVLEMEAKIRKVFRKINIELL